MTTPAHTIRHRAVTWPRPVAGASLVLAACGSSSSKATTSPSTGAPAASGASNAAVTLSTANVPGVGTVLVNGDGRTVYELSTEHGGNVTCTTTGSCTTYWPPALLPAGTTAGVAGAGAQASLLGTAKDPAGGTRLTYGGWPLYTFSGDSGPGSAKGQSVASFGGTWYALTPAGTPAVSASSSTTSGSSRGGGY